MRARAREIDASGANYLRIIFQIQRRGSGVWNTVFQRTHTSSLFPNDFTDYQFTKSFAFDWEAEDFGPRHRVRTFWEFWDERPGNDVRLASAVENFPCRAALVNEG